MTGLGRYCSTVAVKCPGAVITVWKSVMYECVIEMKISTIKLTSGIIWKNTHLTSPSYHHILGANPSLLDSGVIKKKNEMVYLNSL